MGESGSFSVKGGEEFLVVRRLVGQLANPTWCELGQGSVTTYPNPTTHPFCLSIIHPYYACTCMNAQL